MHWTFCASLIIIGSTCTLVLLFTGLPQFEENDRFSVGIFQPPSTSCQAELAYLTTEQTRRCLQLRLNRTGRPLKIVIAGDSRMRQLYFSLLYQATGLDEDWTTNHSVPDPGPAPTNPNRGLAAQRENQKIIPKHNDRSKILPEIGLEAKFHWLVALTDGKLRSIVKDATSSSTDLLLVSHGLWSIWTCIKQKKSDSDCLKQYQKDLKGHIPAITALPTSTSFIWVPQNAILEPLIRRKFTDPIGKLKDRNIVAYNNAAKNVLSTTRSIFWGSHYEASRVFRDTYDGLHLGRRTKEFDAQVLFDYVCAKQGDSFRN
ncbi:hypothetical protein BV898_03494 [Hypsibius exemplaris]|uniref:Uncharacterized protein n=1 Tax=Hypsibius exemplaris TaxID=2072580 RepID=A0A1W0X567_HYPEX|nr:hypothetical protein BV898_03494 [Hypsibius exemplaris]